MDIKSLLYVLIAITNFTFIIINLIVDSHYYKRLRLLESKIKALENGESK